MRSGRMTRRLVATAGMGAIIAMGVLSACAGEEAPAPETVTETVTETAAPPPPPAPPPAAPVVPTEKAPRIDPGQPNPFSPTVIAPGPATPAPGNIPGDN
jgi:hypothetical protein